ncbi:MAG TPA: hypothetical protein VLK56_01630 [Solirubrobacterales bacterium]|nr:hypothetical protein [Solirubrobacterales bacterium]
MTEDGQESLRIPARFNGPKGSGNGGYSAGVVAGLLGGEAEVSLRRPVPLDVELEVVRDGDDGVRVLDGDALVAEGRATEVDVELPPPVNLDEAGEAALRYRGSSDDVFSRCFVCGKAREDSFEVFAGPVEDRPLVATPWTPPPWSADRSGHVRPEFVWAALDCPTYFAAYMGEEGAFSVLARFAARTKAEIPAAAEHAVIAWPLEAEGRKRHAASALLSAEGETLAVASALLVEPRG